jgi:uncharacterized membrane protein YhaH (DUF805 family)
MPAANNPFSIKGRLGQQPYWLLVGMILAARILAAVVVVFRPDWTLLLKTDFLLVFLALLVGKRMRDFGLSALWGWAGVLLISFVLPIASLIIWQPSLDPADPFSIFPEWVGLLVFVLLLGLIIWVGVKKGDPGPNRFGDAGGGPAPEKLARVEPRLE